MDKVPLDDKILLKKLQEVAKCPICLSLLRPPLWYCVNGHCICMACKGSLTTCPTCRGSILQTAKILIFEDILNCLSRPCTFDGCDVFQAEEDLKFHQTVCPFRKVSCRLDYCSWEGEVNSLLDHIIKTHKNATNNFKEESEVVLPKFKLDVNTYAVAYVRAYDCIFWLYNKTDLTKGIHKICFVCKTNTIEIVNDFYSTVNFSSSKQPDMKYQYTQKVYNEDVDIESVFSSETCFAIPLSETSHFINEDCDLCWSYKIFRNIINLVAT